MFNLEIDVAAAIKNIMFIRKNVDAEICAVIKANCYGLGIDLATFIEPYVDSFSVASLDEAREARSLGLKKKIYILGAINPSDFDYIDNLVYTVCSEEDIDFLTGLNKPFDVAIKINSGMNRLGASLKNAERLFERVMASKVLNLDSTYTHFYNIDDGSYKRQFELFCDVTAGIDAKKHCCASSCLRLDRKYHLDMVRCGLSIYGYGNPNLTPAVRVYSTVAAINDVRAGECVGYGNCVMDCDRRIAVLRGGYADGYRRVHSAQYASFDGSLLPLVGQVSMDMLSVDVTHKNVSIGDKIYLIDNLATIEMLANASNTVVYEILTSFNGARIKREYIVK